MDAAAAAEAEEDDVEGDAPDIEITGCECGWWGKSWRGNARECGGKRDSTMERRVSHSSDVQPSTDSVVSLGHAHVWETGGAARF